MISVEPMTSGRSSRLVDPPLPVRGQLFGLWTAMLMVFAYVDILGFWREDVVRGALNGEVPGAGLTIGQGFLLFSTGYVLGPIAMSVVSLLVPARVSRILNVVVSLLYAVSVAALTIGESWAYYVLGSVAEVALLLAIAWIAWRWPRQSTADPHLSAVDGVSAAPTRSEAAGKAR